MTSIRQLRGEIDMRGVTLIAVFFALTALDLAAQGRFEVTESLARPKSYVGDYAKVIDKNAQRQLETKLAQLRKRVGIEFVVVTLETTGTQDIFDYSLEAARRWGIGGGANDKGGLLLMIAIKDRKWRIQLSRNLEADLPDAVVKVVGDKMAVPFRQGDYAAGLNQCISDLIARLAERRGFKNPPD